ncbi:MAG: efflux transporter periplasmic adaptor subunit, partial [Planctomycetota bacterium]
SLAAARALLAERIAGPRAERITAARARVDELAARLDLAQTIADRRAVLSATDAISIEELQSAEREVTALEASAAAARADLDELESGTRSEQIDAQRAEVARLEAELAQIDVDLAQSQLVAPFEGVVRSVSLDLGTVPIPGAGMIDLVETEAPEAWIGLPPARVPEVEGRDDLTVVVGGVPYAARCRAALPGVDVGTRTRTVVLELAETEIGIVVPGEVAELTLAETEDVDGIWLAADGLVRSRRGLWAAFVLEPLGDDDRGPVDATHRLQRRELETLSTDGQRVLARGDLANDELVLASGAQRVSAGQYVRLSSVDDVVAAAAEQR